MKNHRGFTLMELMVVIAAIAIVAVIALPSYQNALIKSRRPSAQTALLELASREERYYTTNNTYVADLATLGYPAQSSTLAVPDGGNHFYDLSVDSADISSFTLKAVPVNSQAGDTECATYTYTHLGVRANQGGSGSACWR